MSGKQEKIPEGIKTIRRYYGADPDSVPEPTEEQMEEVRNACMMMQKKQEERRRMKEEDPEGYKKMREKELAEMYEWMEDILFWD